MNTQRLLFINAMVLLTVTTNCILQVWCETQIAVVQCLVQQASSIQPELLWSSVIILNKINYWLPFKSYILVSFTSGQWELNCLPTCSPRISKITDAPHPGHWLL